MKRKKISDHTGKLSGSDMGDENIEDDSIIKGMDKSKFPKSKAVDPAEKCLDNDDGIVKEEKKNLNISASSSSDLNTKYFCRNVIYDDDYEWVSDGDHMNASITLRFDRQKINKILIADRVSEEASMINGTIEIYGVIQAGEASEKLKTISFDGLPGNGQKIEVNVGGIFASQIVVKAGDKVWGKNIGLRYLNFDN